MQKHIDDAFRAHPDLQRALDKLAQPMAMKKGTVLFRQGQKAKGVYLVRTGKAVLSVRATPGGAVAPRMVGPGCVLGLPANICGKPYSLTAEILEDSELAYVGREKVVKLLRNDGQLCLHAVEILGRELATMRNELSGSPKRRAAGAAAV